MDDPKDAEDHGSHEAETGPAGARDGGGGSHHAHMVADYRRRFWFSLVLSVPTLLLSPLIQDTLGVDASWNFSGDSFILWGFATVIFFYGGWPFLTGIFTELGHVPSSGVRVRHPVDVV